jgi:hypothetical protein
MRQVLEGSVELLLPGSGTLVKKHVWRNADYVGTSGNTVAIWRGWSANLSKVDRRYRSVYIDYIENSLPTSENERLFGSVFAEAIKSQQPCVYLFVTSCPLEKHTEVLATGFTFRRIRNVIHPGVVTDVKSFLETPLEVWITFGVELVNLQTRLRS